MRVQSCQPRMGGLSQAQRPKRPYCADQEPTLELEQTYTSGKGNYRTSPGRLERWAIPWA